LKAHNEYRGRHAAQPLQINMDINSFAQSYAQYLARYDQFNHNENARPNGLGENLYKTCSFPNAPDVKSKRKINKIR
jgi:hypothetical protein